MSVEQMLKGLGDWMQDHGFKLVVGLVALWICWKLIKKVEKVINLIFEKRNIDATLASFLEGIISVALKILTILLVMGYVGFDTTGIAAVVASAGLAIGLAVQGSLSNFTGGVIILFIRPFNVGDFIEGAGYSGVVEKIGMFYTNITTLDNKLILIPNGTLANGSLINYTAKETRRVDLHFTAAYEEDVLRVKKVIMDVINEDERILKDPEPFVSVESHGDNAVGFIVRVWVNTEDYWGVHYSLMEKVKIRFDEKQISIPYPQMDVHLKQKN